MADSQSQGKGRLGRSWQSPPGVNLYLSVVLRPEIPLTLAPRVTLLTGVAIANALARVSGLDIRLKWPNDIFIHGKKVAGILSEMEAKDSKIQFIILGIGVNVNWPKKDIPADLQEIATSLQAEAQRELSRDLVAAEIFEQIEREYASFVQEGFSPRLQKEWNRLSMINQQWVTLTEDKEEFEGKVLGLDTDGALRVIDREGKTQRFITGEVSLRLEGRDHALGD